ncbi:excinuclease ABC subunit UvrA [Candidatus Dojkabacteria bacterium]|nr:excinuclease ABC subunit UvrA [Candidatus Dojkabacteria bacterium]
MTEQKAKPGRETANPNTHIIIKGARTNNLKNIDVNIPKNKFVVITGVSGSGKSSLAFDTIYAEGHRKYVESLSAYARQFLGVMDKPDVDIIEGLSPAISIDQKSAGHNPRSTVGTVTEIYDYLRLLFARIGRAHCPDDGTPLESQTIQEIVDSIKQIKGTKIMLLAPIIKNRKGTYEELFERLSKQGYVRVRVNGEVFSLEEDIKLDRYVKHNIDVVIDRLIIDKKLDKAKEKRITDSVEAATSLAEGEIIVSREENGKWIDKLYSENSTCKTCGRSFQKLEPHSFSFNSPFGACENCSGLGIIKEIDPELIYNPRLTISEGGIYPWSRMADNPNSFYMKLIEAVAKKHGFSMREPIGELSENARNIILYGTDREKYVVTYDSQTYGTQNNHMTSFEGVINNLERRYKQTDSDYIRKEIENYMRTVLCPVCEGERLKKESLSVFIDKKNINQMTEMSIKQAVKWIETLENGGILTRSEEMIARQVIKEITARLNFLEAVGLEYLTINRKANSLSGGEAQRIRLASQIGSGLTGVLYVLDEPSIGLHQRDNERLLSTLKELKNLGNTVLVVEHDEDTIKKADHIIDIGPGAGEHGGEVVCEGKIESITKNKNSLTGQYLAGKKEITKSGIAKEVEQIIKKHTKNGTNNGNTLKIIGAAQNNLKSIDVELPLGKMIAITGVSGSGKSSLINDILYKSLARTLNRAKSQPGNHKSIEGIENIDKVVNIDQSPIGRTPRSNPATYTGLFTPIRDLFASTREAKSRGYKTGRFSFNVKGGRCEKCQGDGVIKIEMQFLPDVYIKCETCNGQRYNRDTLQIDYKGRNISNVLDMTVEQALAFFAKIPAISNKLQTLMDVGLGYIKLGQPATTLSGGEAQRVKLATELSKRSTGKTLYILDEPTTGLHFEDVRKLLIVLHSLVAKGNTVIVIEHNMDVIKTSDWIIDLGPEGGDKGGEIIATGTPEQVANSKESYTGEWLRRIF